MRILVVSNYLPPGRERGYELACYNLCKGLRARGHDVHVVSSPTVRHPAENQDWIERPLSVREFSTPDVTGAALHVLLQHEARVSQLANTQLILTAIREFRPEHILTFNLVGIGGLAIVDLIDMTGIPWTMNLGDWVPNELTVRVPQAVRAIYDAGATGTLFTRGRIAAVSQTLLTEIERGGISLGDNVTIIPRGVAISDVERSRPYREGGVTRFVSAGAVAPQKGMDLILDATRLLQDEAAFEFTIDVYGGGKLDHYSGRARELGIAGRITFHGAVSQREVVVANAAADAFLFPTWSREPGASVPIEAAVVGAVPILTGTCGPAERFIDGVSAIKIRRTVESLADAMRRVGLGEVDLEALGAAGRALAAGDLSFGVSVDRLERVLAVPLGGERENRLDDESLDQEIVSKHESALALVYEIARSTPQ